MPVLLFVYGSLMRGGKHHAELADARFVGPAATERRCGVVRVAEYPALVPGNDVVPGELYEIDETSLLALDAFEGEMYRRDTVALDDGRVVLAYVLAAAAGPY